MTGLPDFEAVRLADPLFDPAWWAWPAGFAGPGVLEAAWPAFLARGTDLTAHTLQAGPWVPRR